MGRKRAIALMALACLLAAGQAGFSAPAPAKLDAAAVGETALLPTVKERTSYAIGVEMGRNYKRLEMDIDPDLIARGLRDAFSGGKLLMTDANVDDAMITFRAQLIAKARMAKQTVDMDRKKAGEEFLAANAKKEGVVILPSGLQYKILKQGKGKMLTDGDVAKVQYRGRLINGVEFESTYKAEEPALINLADQRVIAGFREALRLMPVGSKWELYIPSRLAYQDKGKKPSIGPNETLIFEVDLIGSGLI